MDQPKCFKCEKPIEAAVREPTQEDYWSMPCGVHFRGGSNFGSTVYDTLIDKKQVELIVCDDCLKKHQPLLRVVEACKTCSLYEQKPKECGKCWLKETELQKKIKEGRIEGKSFRQILDEHKKEEQGD